jgi:hypothetical protein
MHASSLSITPVAVWLLRSDWFFSALTRSEQAAVEKGITALSQGRVTSSETPSPTNQQAPSRTTNLGRAWQGLLKSVNRDTRAEELTKSTVYEDLQRYRSLAAKLYL